MVGQCCDWLGASAINVFAQRWLTLLPLPFGEADRDGGYPWLASALAAHQVPTACTCSRTARAASAWLWAAARLAIWTTLANAWIHGTGLLAGIIQTPLAFARSAASCLRAAATSSSLVFA